ncbi:MAG: NAD(+) synthase [Phycisphaerales bacterium]|nr:NAD(+) synthase [Phycisphaerales bacterium]
MTTAMAAFSKDVLKMDYAASAAEIEAGLRALTGRLHRRGLVLGVSGGIDSSVCASLAARAVGPGRVRALLMPERDSSPSSLAKGKAVCEQAGIRYDIMDLTQPLEALGCYSKRDEAIRKVFPQFRPGDRFKIAVAQDVLNADRMNYFTLVVRMAADDGRQVSARMPLDVYLAVVAATNLKQRVRKLTEYTLAEELNYAVIGTPNLLEYDQGFFVRGGDGLADIKPIAHLYKTQVFGMGRFLGLPKEVVEQTPSTDTYSLPQTQEEFYFALAYPEMDMLLWAYTHGVAAEDAGRVMGLRADQVGRAYRDIEAKRRVSRQLHAPALLVREHDWSGPG